MTPTFDDKRPSPLDFPDGLSQDEKAARWTELLKDQTKLTDGDLDAALRELMSRSRRGG